MRPKARGFSYERRFLGKTMILGLIRHMPPHLFPFPPYTVLLFSEYRSLAFLKSVTYSSF